MRIAFIIVVFSGFLWSIVLLTCFSGCNRPVGSLETPQTNDSNIQAFKMSTGSENTLTVLVKNITHDGCDFVIITSSPTWVSTHSGVGSSIMHHPCCKNPKHTIER